MRYAYLHGLSSGPGSRKGIALAHAFEDRGQRLTLLDLNRPSLERLSFAAALDALDDMDRSGAGQWRLIGSSWGGWLSARWAELNPERVDRLVLLSPAFDFAPCWERALGSGKLSDWQTSGELPVPNPEGGFSSLHYGFYQESLVGPAYPDVTRPALILHGVSDELIPIAHSRKFASEHANVRLVELDDDHSLQRSIPRITEETLRFFDL